MKPWMVVPVALGGLVVGYLTGSFAESPLGSQRRVEVEQLVVPSVQAKETKFSAENECSCGDVRTCPFGPGIVGQQQCRTDAMWNNVWSRCEPK